MTSMKLLQFGKCHRFQTGYGRQPSSLKAVTLPKWSS
jgi:hypothetical protein